MRSLLNALREGRLVELPDTDKAKSLEYLANLIEAVPDLPSTPELYEAMMAREKAMNTGIGMGVACPHVRAPGNGELVSAVGWSPAGIDYGAPDGKKVHLVVMYYIPESQKNVYLKEISSLAGAVRREGGIQPIANAQDIATVRERLLDWVGSAIESSVPEAKARMIRLESRQAAAEAAPAHDVGGIQIVPVFVLQLPDQKPIVLSQQPELLSALEKDDRLGALVQQNAQFDAGGFRLVPRTATQYPNARSLHEYSAVKLGPSSPSCSSGAWWCRASRWAIGPSSPAVSRRAPASSPATRCCCSDPAAGRVLPASPLPPLRERRADIPLLVEHFLRACASKWGKWIRSMDEKTMELLRTYSWPGNVREL